MQKLNCECLQLNIIILVQYYYVQYEYVFVHEYVRQSRYPFKTENDDECAAKISDRIQLQHKSYILICERLYAYIFKASSYFFLRWS